MPTIIDASSTPNSATLRWTQPSGEVVMSYNISYTFTIISCFIIGDSSEVIPLQQLTVISAGTYEHTISPLNPNSEYTFRLAAIYNGSVSLAAERMVTTMITSK